MNRKIIVVAVIMLAFSIMTIMISMWIVNVNKNSKNDLEIEESFIKKIIKSEKLDRLTPVGIDRFMANVPQIKMPISTANYLQTLYDFNAVFRIDSITRLDNNRVAVVYLLKSDIHSFFAVLLFENTISDSTGNSSIDPEMYSYWFYTGDCFFYSEQLSSLVKGSVKKGCSFSELGKAYADISGIFSRFYDGTTELPIWMTRILTDEGGKLIVLGFDESFLESGDDMIIENSKVLEIRDVSSGSLKADFGY